MLAQLVYVSNRKKKPAENEIEEILDACKRNNPALGITGALLYSDKKFMQLVEGENKVIMELYDKIKGDTRHENCVMLSYMSIKERAFPSWHMGCKNFSTDEISYRTDISATDRASFSSLLNGKKENGDKIKQIISKFFK